MGDQLEAQRGGDHHDGSPHDCTQHPEDTGSISPTSLPLEEVEAVASCLQAFGHTFARAFNQASRSSQAIVFATLFGDALRGQLGRFSSGH